MTKLKEEFLLVLPVNKHLSTFFGRLKTILRDSKATIRVLSAVEAFAHGHLLGFVSSFHEQILVAFEESY